DAEGLLRPDKIVAYFPTLDGLRTASDRLATRLDGCPAHGVPFTSELSGGGLLSWGVDPPASERLVNWQPQESWRLWLTNRLANALFTARAGGAAGALETRAKAPQHPARPGGETHPRAPPPPARGEETPPRRGCKPHKATC